MSEKESGIRRATRSVVKPFIGIYGESGTGKTFSALILARGLAGPNGDIVLVDSESGRGSTYAGTPPVGDYNTVEILPPFSPQAYIAKMDEVEASGAAVGILDSASHEWEGVGGVLDLAGDSEARTGRAGLHNWKQPKFEHAKFIQRLMRARIPWIVCLRAKFKTRQGKDGGRTVIIKDDYTSPIQAEDFIFECLCHGEILPQSHKFRLTKHSHPDLKKCFPEDGMIEVRHGKMIADWCNGAAVNPAAEKSFKAKFWTMTKKVHNGDKSKLESKLREAGLLADSVTLEQLTEENFEKLCKDAEHFL
jgi:hypothetical protein